MLQEEAMEILGEGEALLADGFEEALLGVCYSFGKEPKAAYDLEKCRQILMQRDELTREEAEEHLAFNVLGAYVGEGTPVFIDRIEKGDPV